MSPLLVKMILKKEVVLNSVAEFLGCWTVGGKATLSLNTQDGVATIVFSNTLSGHPEDPLHPRRQKYTTSFFIWIVGFMWDIMIFEILCGINVGSYVKSLCVGI